MIVEVALSVTAVLADDVDMQTKSVVFGTRPAEVPPSESDQFEPVVQLEEVAPVQ